MQFQVFVVLLNEHKINKNEIGYFVGPYQRVYWTDGMRNAGDPDNFHWATTGKALDASVMWLPNEPGPDKSRNSLFFLTETKGLISGNSQNWHSVICEKN